MGTFRILSDFFKDLSCDFRNDGEDLLRQVRGQPARFRDRHGEQGDIRRFAAGEIERVQDILEADIVGGQGLSNFDLGRVNDELGFGGLVLSASNNSVSVLIRALQASNRVQILSRPQEHVIGVRLRPTMTT